jgi:NTP pyrophosphatase (non-canonical NTP hydrolase)
MFSGKLNEFCKIQNENIREKGFWDGLYNSDMSVETRDAFVSQKIALIMSECGEALEAMRKRKYGLEEKDSFEDELADVFIRLADLCGELDIDIEKQINWKLAYNKSRSNKHGKEF